MRTLLLLPLLTSACLLPLTREQYVGGAAIEVCAAEDACDDIGDDAQYPAWEDCVDETEDLFDAAWPPERCPTKAFDRAAYEDCVDEARDAACDEGLDLIEAILDCRADVVCTN